MAAFIPSQRKIYIITDIHSGAVQTRSYIPDLTPPQTDDYLNAIPAYGKIFAAIGATHPFQRLAGGVRNHENDTAGACDELYQMTAAAFEGAVAGGGVLEGLDVRVIRPEVNGTLGQTGVHAKDIVERNDHEAIVASGSVMEEDSPMLSSGH